MIIPMFTNEDDYYEYRREEYDKQLGFWDDDLSDDDWEVQFDGFKDSE